MKLLEVGDVVYIMGYGSFERIVIDRVTKTMAIAETKNSAPIRIKRTYHDDGFCSFVRQDTWSTTRIHLANAKYDRMYAAWNLRKQFNSIDVKLLSISQLKRIIAIANEEETND